MTEKSDNSVTILNGLNGVNMSMDYICDVLLDIIKEQPENKRLVEALQRLSTERVNLTDYILLAAENMPSPNLQANVEAARNLRLAGKSKNDQVYKQVDEVVPKTDSAKMWK